MNAKVMVNITEKVSKSRCRVCLFSVRHSSTTIPFQTKPTNKYNSQTSAFNFKPKPTPGIIYNPPSALPLLKQTPKPFLPNKDPRKHIELNLDSGHKVSPYEKLYSQLEIDDMPLIHGSKKHYHVDDKTSLEILKLRTSDPKKWTIKTLCNQYNVSPYFIINLTKDYRPKPDPQPTRLTNNQMNQQKRVQMWLSNQY